jgi:hypothetical protein
MTLASRFKVRGWLCAIARLSLTPHTACSTRGAAAAGLADSGARQHGAALYALRQAQHQTGAKRCAPLR